MIAVFVALIYCSFLFEDPTMNIDDRVKDLVSRLSLEQKVGQLMNDSPRIEELGIGPYDWWNEALHGVARSGNSTVFPQVIGLGATFDIPNVKKTYEFVSDEARAKHQRHIERNETGRYTGLTFWTPNINIFRDPRWGRGQETFGEDPYLTSTLGSNVVAGLQGNLSNGYYKVHACAKHFGIHSGPEPLRHKFNVSPNPRDLALTYLPAFKKLVESNVAEVMCAYNRVFGQPACASDYLFGKLREWNFQGMVTSDCDAIDDFYRGGRHMTHRNASSASADALRNGTTLECGESYKALVTAIQEGFITEDVITESVSTIFKHRFMLGMFDPPEIVPYALIPYDVVLSPDHADHALLMARESITLL
jgi:beta-glucosidase